MLYSTHLQHNTTIQPNTIKDVNIIILKAPTRSISTNNFFFFNDTATTEIYTLSLHDALPISLHRSDFKPSSRLVTLSLLAEPREGSSTFQSLAPLRSTTSGLPAAVSRARLTSFSSNAGKKDLSRSSASVLERSCRALASTSITGPCPSTAATAAGFPPLDSAEGPRSRVFGSFAPSSQILTVTSGFFRKRGMSAGPSARKPDARRSRMLQRSELTGPLSALRASGAVIFHPVPSRSTTTRPFALSSSTRLALSYA